MMIFKLFMSNEATLIFALSALILSSCEKNNDAPDITANNLKGMFVVCEGTYGNATGDITYYNTETSQATRSLYYEVNGAPAGDVVQAFAIADTLGFILVNNSQKVVVVNMKDFRIVKTIAGLSYPRSIVRANENTMYVTNGNGISANHIYSIDLATLSVTDTLYLQGGPEAIIESGKRIFVAISGGWNNDGNTVAEVDTETFSVKSSYTVSSIPVDLTADRNGNIWVYCKGAPDYSNYPDVSYSGMGICRINITTNSVDTFPLSTMDAPGINNITAGADGSTIYYINDALYSLPITATSLPASGLVSGLFYGIGCDPKTGNIICLDASESKAFAYDPSGTEKYSFDTDDYPNSVVFSY